MSQPGSPLRLSHIPSCPICGGNGHLRFAGLKDRNCGIPGTWDYKECTICSSFWLVNRPIDDDLPMMYVSGEYFTHAPTPTGLDEPDPAFQLKLGVLERTLGYSCMARTLFTRLGNALASIPVFRQRAAHLVRYIPCTSNGNILEIGSGNGSFLSRMRAFGWKVQGIEPDPVAAGISAGNGIPTFCGPAQAAVFPESFFDAIHMNHVIEHTVGIPGLVKRISASLKPGGIFVSISPNPQSLVARWAGRNWYGLADVPRHLCIPSPKALLLLFDPALFEVSLFSSYSFFYWMFKYSFPSGKPFSAIYRLLDVMGPRLFFLVSLVAESFFPLGGDEIIIVAQKRPVATGPLSS